MKLFDFFKGRKSGPSESTASLAKERLQLVIAHQKADELTSKSILTPELLSQLQTELLAVVAKYVKIKDDALSIKHSVEDGASMIELSVSFDEKQSTTQPSSAACDIAQSSPALSAQVLPAPAVEAKTSMAAEQPAKPTFIESTGKALSPASTFADGDIGRLSKKFNRKKAF